MIDIKLFRENPELIRKSEIDRFKDPKKVDQVIKLDEEWREALQKVNGLRGERNKISKDIGITKKQGKDISKLTNRVKDIKKEIAELESLANTKLEERDKIRYTIGNILIEGVPIAKDEEGNVIVRKWGKTTLPKFKVRGHADMVEILDVVELKKAAEVSGARTYYLKKDLVFLNLALINYALDFLVNEKKFTPFWTPAFLRREIMEGASELEDFEEQLYSDPTEDVFFIATSEQTLAALHYNELIDKDTLPRKYCGYSPCFRREAGAHGRDTKGIFRVHQFDKIEQFIYSKPEESHDLHEEMINNAEELCKRLKLPYRVVNIASGELNANAAKKYDLEVWFPAQEAYREAVSCSNCTNYQARKLNVTGGKAGGDKDFVHTLNSTAIATSRTICAILENYQEKDGTVKIPEVLKPYMHGIEEIKPV